MKQIPAPRYGLILQGNYLLFVRISSLVSLNLFVLFSKLDAIFLKPLHHLGIVFECKKKHLKNTIIFVYVTLFTLYSQLICGVLLNHLAKSDTDVDLRSRQTVTEKAFFLAVILKARIAESLRIIASVRAVWTSEKNVRKIYNFFYNRSTVNSILGGSYLLN